ncbi:hypothetical protein N665_1045s0001 [Sinapis alba]|nr:hypothetical protein N665_1045s0001 [Sinapis alba]
MCLYVRILICNHYSVESIHEERDRSIPISSFSIDSFRIEMYGSTDLCVYIDHVHGLTKNVQTLYLPLPFYESLPFCVWHHHSLWQPPLIQNLI